jgi:hypothetical protein
MSEFESVTNRPPLPERSFIRPTRRPDAANPAPAPERVVFSDPLEPKATRLPRTNNLIKGYPVEFDQPRSTERQPLLEEQPDLDPSAELDETPAPDIIDSLL